MLATRLRMAGKLPAPSATLQTDLAAYWTLNEASGARGDSVGASDLTDHNSVGSSTAGRHGNAASFTYTTPHYLTATSSAALQTGNIAFHVWAWVYPTRSGASQAIVVKGRADTLSGIEYGLVYRFTDRFGFDLWQSGSAQSVTASTFGAITLNRWYFVEGWVDLDANTVNVAVNGVTDSATKTKTPTAGSAAVSIGAYADGGAPFGGLIDEVGFRKRVPTAAEREALYSDGVGTTYPFTRSVTRIDTTVGGQDALLLVPTRHTGVVVLYHHGAGEDETALMKAEKAAIVGALTQAGYLLAGSNAHGNNWGNQAALDDYAALYAYLDANYTVSDVLILSQSMGGLSGLLNIADADYAVSGWAGIYPVTNLADMWDGGAGSFAAAIKTAYSFANNADYSTATSGHDPNLRAAADYAGVPMRFYASASDTVADKSANSDTFSALVASVTPEETVVVASGEHGDPSHFQPDDLLTFFQRCVA